MKSFFRENMKNAFRENAMIAEAKKNGKGFSWILELLIFVLVFLVSSGLEAIPVGIATVVWVFSSFTSWQGSDFASIYESILSQMPDWLTEIELYSTVLLTLGVLLYCLVIERRNLRSVGFCRSHALREYLVGMAVGIAMISATVGVGVLSGAYRIELSPSFSIGAMLVFFFGFLLQGMSEEVLCRGYLMVSLSRKNAVWLAVLLNSALFAALHLGNPGISPLALFNILLAGAVFSVYVLKRGNLWGACAIHSMWNFFQGNIFGISVSGIGSGSSPLSTVETGRALLFAGGSFGIEGSLADTVVEIVTLLILIFLIPSSKDNSETNP